MGEPALVLEPLGEAAARQATRFVVIEGGKSAAVGATATEVAVGAEATAAGASSSVLGTVLLPVLVFLAILLYPSSIGPEPDLNHPRPEPQPPPAPAPNAVQECPQAEKLKHENQTCSNERLAKLQGEKDKLTEEMPKRHRHDTGNKGKMDRIPCSYIRERIAHMKRLLAKRWEIQNECFGGQPDDDHKIAIGDLENGIKKYEKMAYSRPGNCLKGHPMAEQ